MAKPNPNDPNRRDIADNDVRQAARLDDKPQSDPTLAERPARSGRIALLGIAIAIILGTVFYGLNSSTGPTETSSTSSQSTSPNTAQNNAAKPPVAPGVRDVTPSNTQPGVTTGTANSTQPTNPQSSNTPSSGAAK